MNFGKRKHGVCAAAGIGSLLLLIAGCKVGPDYRPPDPNMPDRWLNAPASTDEPRQLQQWWFAFGDPILTELIKRADQNNLDLRAGLARIIEARALRNAASGQYWPTVDAVGSYTRSRESENGTFSSFGGLSSDQFNLHTVGVDAAWEIDLFGRIRRSVESADAAWQASLEDFRSVQISLFAEVARNYIELRAAQARIRYALANIDIQRQTLQLTRDRFEADLAPKLDVTQAQLNLANSESEIPLLRLTEASAHHRLAVLLGTIPQDLTGLLRDPADMPRVPADVNAGIPAELLRRRPDIRRAERALAAQTAQVGVAAANLYPIFSLTGAFSLQAAQLSDVGDLSSRAWSFGPGVRWNLFNGNQYRSLVQAEEARTFRLAAAYESAVLRAVEEVENAMIGFAQENRRLAALERSVTAAEESVMLAETLYRNGLTDFQNVLFNQRSLSVQQDRLAVSRGQLLQQAVNLYTALGGGWNYMENEVTDLPAQAAPAQYDALEERP
jgi:NodT family efflux transporter outer membrane factor (OMF) lipoprotein